LSRSRPAGRFLIRVHAGGRGRLRICTRRPLDSLAALPMVLPVRLGKQTDSVQPASRSYISWIVKDVMQSAADLAMEAGDEFAQARLQQASTHWLRHTFATDLFDSGADVLSVRDLLDHASISTTSRYLHRPEERLRADLERLSGEPPMAKT